MTESILTSPPSSADTAVSPTRDVQVFPLTADTLALRSRSWNRLRFEIEYALERGTTANAYIIRGHKTALIDPPGESFREQFLAKLQHLSANTEVGGGLPPWSRLWNQIRWMTQQTIDVKQLGFDLAQLDYIILGHVNPNRIETLKVLLEIVPTVTIVCSNPAATALQAALPEHDLKLQVIRSSSNATLDLGQGHQLQFVPTPTPRWPDSLWTYDPHTQILFTDKFFGAHLCGEARFDVGEATLPEDQRYYFDCLMATHIRQVESALAKVADLAVKTYAPGHGPVIRHGVRELTQAYRQWGQQQQTQTLMVALLYASAYGNTATIGQAIARGITKAGVRVELINCEVATPDEIEAIAQQCHGFIIGSPTLGGPRPHPDPKRPWAFCCLRYLKTNLWASLAPLAGVEKPLIYSNPNSAMRGIGLGLSPLKSSSNPRRSPSKPVKKWALTLCSRPQKKPRKSRYAEGDLNSAAKPHPQNRLSVALSAPFVSSSTQQGELSSAMLASWVSQATFNPPVLTVAVAKDRAVESPAPRPAPLCAQCLRRRQPPGHYEAFP